MNCTRRNAGPSYVPLHIQEVGEVLEMIVVYQHLGNEPIWSPLWNLQMNNVSKTIFECNFAPVRQQKRKADPEQENLTPVAL
jgi:hypothetical protein